MTKDWGSIVDEEEEGKRDPVKKRTNLRFVFFIVFFVFLKLNKSIQLTCKVIVGNFIGIIPFTVQPCFNKNTLGLNM